MRKCVSAARARMPDQPVAGVKCSWSHKESIREPSNWVNEAGWIIPGKQEERIRCLGIHLDHGRLNYLDAQSLRAHAWDGDRGTTSFRGLATRPLPRADLEVTELVD